MQPLLQVKDLTVTLRTAAGRLVVVDSINFQVRRNSVLGIVGESGSGKSITCNALVQLLPRSASTSGYISLDGRDILSLSRTEFEDLRGNEIGCVFQDPMTSLNPSMTVGRQIAETIIRHKGVSAASAHRRAVELMDMVGIPAAQRRASAFPHEFSGGMRQRVLIAMAVSCEPKLLIADEPTTALDVTIQAQILDLLRTMQREMDLSVIFVTHDLGVVADICDDVVVMYAGEIVEAGSVDNIFASPAHPYTESLLRAIKRDPSKPLTIIPGAPPAIGSWDSGCRFSSRCSFAFDRCSQHPSLLKSMDRHVRCHRQSEAKIDLH